MRPLKLGLALEGESDYRVIAPEHDPTPKSTLNRIVRVLTAGREITFASFADELTEAVRLPVLRQRCPHFDEFARNLINCVREWQRL